MSNMDSFVTGSIINFYHVSRLTGHHVIAGILGCVRGGGLVPGTGDSRNFYCALGSLCFYYGPFGGASGQAWYIRLTESIRERIGPRWIGEPQVARGRLFGVSSKRSYKDWLLALRSIQEESQDPGAGQDACRRSPNSRHGCGGYGLERNGPR